MIGVGPVRKVQAGNVHSSYGKLGDFVFSVGCWPQCGNDFSSAHDDLPLNEGHRFDFFGDTVPNAGFCTPL